MSDRLIVNQDIDINAPVDKVWEVLTNSEFIKEWDDLPEDFHHRSLSLGEIINWEGFSRLTVVTFDPHKHLKLSLYLPKVEMEPGDYDISYSYLLKAADGQTQLTIEIGDFSAIPNGVDYYDAAVEFAESAKQKIKELSEQ